MPEETLEETEVETERRPIPVFKIAAATTAVFFIHRTIRHRRELRRVRKMNDAVDKIMNDRVGPPFEYDPSLKVVEGTCIEIT